MARKTQELGLKGKGVEPMQIAEIDKLAEAYVKERDKRLTQTPKEVAAKQKLIDALHHHAEDIGRQPDGTITYRYDEMIITLSYGKEKLKVAPVESEPE